MQNNNAKQNSDARQQCRREMQSKTVLADGKTALAKDKRAMQSKRAMQTSALILTAGGVDDQFQKLWHCFGQLPLLHCFILIIIIVFIITRLGLGGWSGGLTLF